MSKLTPDKTMTELTQIQKDIEARNIEMGRKLLALPVLLDCLKNVRPYLIPGMNWTDETGELLKKMVDKAIEIGEEAKP